MTNFVSISEFNPNKIAKLFFLLFLISVFFPIRYVFPTVSSFATGLYSDFTSISLYLSDIFLFFAFIFTLWSNQWNFKLWLKNKEIIIFIIWLILATFIFDSNFSGLNIYYFVKFIELIIVAYGTTKLAFSNQHLAFRNAFLLVFLALETLQAIIGLLQFLNQSPLGLNLIGEQIIYPNLWGVAKVVSSGTAYIRAYGTFPHPNLLSAFLLTTIFINIHLLNSTTWHKFTKIWLNLALFINILGLTATFSRAAFLALGIGLLVYFGMLFLKQYVIARSPDSIGTRKQSSSEIDRRGLTNLAMTMIKVLLALTLAFLLFKPWLLTRATVSDPASIERKIYNQTAINIIKDKPIFGLGIGESVLHMKQYTPTELSPWQIQPIHNYFLLSSSELGILGALILIWIFLSHLKAISYKLKAESNPTYCLLLFSLMLMFLVLMNFDHYFYTLQQTQMLLWLILGLIAAETKNPQTGDLTKT